MAQVNAPAQSGWQPVASGLVRVLVVFDAVALLFAGIVHLVGARIPLGFAVFVEPPIVAAGIVESLAGVLFVVAAYTVFAGRASAWGWTLGAHMFAIAGFVLGIVATRTGTTRFNHNYHYVMLAVFIIGLLVLLLPGTRAAMARSSRGR